MQLTAYAHPTDLVLFAAEQIYFSHASPMEYALISVIGNAISYDKYNSNYRATSINVIATDHTNENSKFEDNKTTWLLIAT